VFIPNTRNLTAVSIAYHGHKHTSLKLTNSITDIIVFIRLPGVLPPHHLMSKLKLN